MLQKNSLLILILFFLCASNEALAQVGQSPLTINGIGTLNTLATGRNLGMGGVGIGSSHYLYLNAQNPAMLSRNSFYTTFEAGLSLESRNLNTTELQERTSSGGLDYLAVAFPLLYNRWALNIGLAPYSTVNYNFRSINPIEGAPGQTSSQSNIGSGGTSRAYIATGARLFKGLSAGVRASYIFGAITHQSITAPTVSSAEITPYLASYYSRTNFSDLLFTGGLSYTYTLPEKKNQAIMAGFTYDLGTDVNAEQLDVFSREVSTGSPITGIDTVGSAVNFFLPAKIGTGISFEKLYHYTIAADFSTQNWEDYRNANGFNENLGKSYRLALGGEWIPDYTSAQTGTYYKRMTYRLGLQYEKTPFLLNDQEVNDFGMSFGLSLPISSASSIHTSFLVGQRASLDTNLYSERYFRLSLGVSLNDRWFTKVKYD